MKIKVFDLPAMYGDHHVTEVRRLLLETQGVEDVYASSGFQAVEVQYDEKKVNEQDLEELLNKGGYLGQLITQIESEIPESTGESTGTYFRHTAAYTQTKLTVGFSQAINQNQGRALWPCPGIGLVKVEKEMD
ncbi:heavy-metal-associated domain-containing protein [Chloroflexota bacterium]